MSNKLIDNKELMKEWDYDKNQNVDINKVTLGMGKNFWWVCPKGHSYQATIPNRLTKKSNCPYCSNHKVLKGFNDFNTINPNIAKEWNYERNKGLTPYDVTAGSGKKVWWKCAKGHEWEAVV